MIASSSAKNQGSKQTSSKSRGQKDKRLSPQKNVFTKSSFVYRYCYVRNKIEQFERLSLYLQRAVGSGGIAPPRFWQIH